MVASRASFGRQWESTSVYGGLRPWPRVSKRLDEPPVDPPSQAEAPDETIDPKNLPSWMRQAPKPRVFEPSERAEVPPQLEGIDAVYEDADAVLVGDAFAQEEVELERLPRWMRGLPERGKGDEAFEAELGSADFIDWIPPDE